ncbi:MAG: TetR/AcrR family transcriptional regulator [Myxococcales bacterium]|nr:TetR/AcrR family transcriptional regulator [Myxococcales bacterium]
MVLRDGIPAFTVEAVAEHADVSKPSIYYYFDSKEALIRELVLGLAATERQVAREALDRSPDGPEVLGGFMRAYVEHHLVSLDLFKVQYLWSQVLGFAVGDGDAEVNEGMVALFDAMEARLRHEQEAGRLRPSANPRRLAVSAWMAAQGVVHTLALLHSGGAGLTHGAGAIVDELVAALTVGAFVGDP